MAGPVVAYLGLGGNLGDRLAALAEALALLDAAPGMRRVACSSVYETEPWGVTDQPNFLNLAAGYETTLAPVDLLAACQSVEATVGRTASYRWGPRLIDVDILLYGDAVVNLGNAGLADTASASASAGFRAGSVGGDCGGCQRAAGGRHRAAAA